MQTKFVTITIDATCLTTLQYSLSMIEQQQRDIEARPDFFGNLEQLERMREAATDLALLIANVRLALYHSEKRLTGTTPGGSSAVGRSLSTEGPAASAD